MEDEGLRRYTGDEKLLPSDSIRSVKREVRAEIVDLNVRKIADPLSHSAGDCYALSSRPRFGVQSSAGGTECKALIRINIFLIIGSLPGHSAPRNGGCPVKVRGAKVHFAPGPARFLGECSD